jgi:hypothetical protein
MGIHGDIWIYICVGVGGCPPLRRRRGLVVVDGDIPVELVE